ncbi:MAG: ATP-binding protein [Myxococcota bacterium]
MGTPRFWSSIDVLLPSTLRPETPEVRRRAQLLAIGVLISLASALWSYTQHTLLGEGMRAWFVLAWAAPVSLSLGLLHTTRSLASAAHFFLAVILLGVAISPLFAGNEESVPFSICVVGFTAAYLLGPRSGVFWTFASMAVIAIIAARATDPQLASVGWTATFLTASFGFSGVAIEHQRRSALETAQEERDRLRSLGEAAFDWIIETEGDRIVYASPSIKKIADFYPEEIVGRDLSEFIHPDDWPKLTAWRSRLATETAVTTRLEHRAIDKAGLWHWCEAFAIVHRDAARWTFATRPIERERRRRTREQTADRLQGVSRLAAGVAHDFNNLLTVIGGHAGLLEPSASRDEIVRATANASRLTSQLMGLSKGQPLGQRAVEFGAELDALRLRLREVVGNAVDLSFDVDPGEHWIRAGAHALEEVLTHLLLNAREASDGSGTVRVCVRSGTLSETGRDAVVLSVEDDGRGMDAETLDRAIDPFFSTKTRSPGAGLGLSTVYGLAVQMGGEFELKSAPGEGSRATLRLPRWREHPSRASDARREAPSGEARWACVVEDNRSIRQLIVSTLEFAGYEVTAYPNGDEATAAAEGLGPCDLLVTDIVMPGASGSEVARQFRQRHPDLKVLFVSGYTEEMIRTAEERDEGVAFLEKPFLMSELRARIEQLEG